MKFPKCDETPLGIYPVVDRTEKLKPLYECGITTAQLRIKDLSGDALENEIVEAIQISNTFNVRLFINDYWEFAIKHHAYGVHLGQEDIIKTDIDKLHASGIRLGISTHTTDELHTALMISPSYVAIGPIFETTSKNMTYKPVGIEDLKRWSRKVAYPIVAIGGINIDTIDAVLETRAASGIAMIQGVLDDTKQFISKQKTKQLIERFNRTW